MHLPLEMNIFRPFYHTSRVINSPPVFFTFTLIMQIVTVLAFLSNEAANPFGDDYACEIACPVIVLWLSLRFSLSLSL